VNFAPPVTRLTVNGYRLPSRVTEQIEALEVTHHWDGADELSVVCNGWDAARAVYAILGENVLQAGNQITVESGYGEIDTHHGRFEVVRHEPQFSGPGRASVRVFAYDAMHRMVGPHAMHARRFQETASDSDIVRLYADTYGLVAEVDDTPEHAKYERTTAKGHKSKRPKVVQSIYPTWIKKVGESDLQDLKLLAARNGYLPPRVKFVDDQDRLYFRKPRPLSEQVAAQPQPKGGLLLWRYTPVVGNTVQASAGDCTLTQFSPSYSTSGQPLAVRVVGRDEDGTPIVVEVEVAAGEAPRIVYEGTVTEDLSKPQAVAGKAWLDHFKDRAFSDSAGILVQVLGQYKAQKIETQVAKTVTVRPKTKKKGYTTLAALVKPQKKTVVVTQQSEDEWWAREVLSLGFVESPLSARAYARRWIEARRLLFQTASFTFQNVPTSNWIDIGHIYPVAGVSAEYEGFWMVRKVTHTWRPGHHSVTGQVQRVPAARTMAEVLL